MIKHYLLFAGLLFSMQVIAQTGIGTTTPHASAKLDVYSENKGFLPPRVSLTSAFDRNTISSPATGLLVYCKGDAGLASGYYYWNGSAWATIATEGGSGSVAAEYGAEFLSSNVSVTSSTPVDVITFTLPSAGTWEVISFMRAQGTAGFAAEFAIYDANGVKVPNSEILSAYGESASTGTGVIRITTNGAATYKLKAFATTLSFQAFTDVNGRTGVTWKKISGNAPVTGQSVDYIQASLSANQTVSAIGNINFNSSTGTGISINSGGFNLIANKTYKLEAAVGGSSTGYAYYAWVDNANNILSGGSIGVVMKAGNSYTDAPQDKAVVYYTPTANTTVYLRVVSIAGSLTAFAPSVASGYSSAWATIQQVGSSAIINPWVLSGNNVYNTTGNVGIGTSTPNASAILDINSSSKGVLPPKVVLTGRNGTSSPIASPATGLFVYNTAVAGTASNEVSPGFYFYNGTNWTRMDPEDWSITESITIGAVTTAPTKGTIVYDKVSYRRTSTTSFEVTYNYSQSTAGTAGSGDYLFRLPGNLTFGSSVLKTTSNTYETMVNRVIIGNGYYGDVSGRFRPLGIIPYDNNRFRIMVMDNAFSGMIVGSSAIGLNTGGVSYKFSFILETN